MRKSYLLLFCTCLAAVLLTGCSKSKKTGDLNENGLPVFEFNNEDSVAVRQLADEYVTRFNAKQYDAAADMLYTVRNDSVFPLTKAQRQGYLTAMTAIPAFGAAVKEQKLLSDKDNRVRIAVLMGEGGSLDEEKGTVNFFLNPVYIDGQWYLTLMDRYAEGVGLYQ